MDTSDMMTANHKECDEVFAAVEAAAEKQDWPGLEYTLDRFVRLMQKHLAMEEEVLFPALEKAMSMAAGPISVMRSEHEQMRELFAQLEQLLEARDRDGLLGTSETLLILMQQHNAKEEQVLYPMIDRVLASSAEDFHARFSGWHE
ncbi:MAG: hemerythrin domain-containing protein [Gammaproteobacteria bacterium]|nr:hemerythrin domain-containing protein [Gammaproteobacteria bacterium]